MRREQDAACFWVHSQALKSSEHEKFARMTRLPLWPHLGSKPPVYFCFPHSSHAPEHLSSLFMFPARTGFSVPCHERGARPEDTCCPSHTGEGRLIWWGRAWHSCGPASVGERIMCLRSQVACGSLGPAGHRTACDLPITSCSQCIKCSSSLPASLFWQSGGGGQLELLCGCCVRGQGGHKSLDLGREQRTPIDCSSRPHSPTWFPGNPAQPFIDKNSLIQMLCSGPCVTGDSHN